MRSGRITELKNDFVPLEYIAEEIGCPLSDVFCVCIEAAFPLYVQCLDDIVDQAGDETGRSFWVNCRVPDLIVRELVRCTEISVEQELLLAGTMTPNGSESWAKSLLIQWGPGRYTFKPANRDVTIRKRSLGVMKGHIDLIRAAIEHRKEGALEKIGATGERAANSAPIHKREKGCPEKFTLYWLEQELLNNEDPTFAQQALDKLLELEKQQPEKFRSTYTTASSATALINRWLEHRELTATRFGKPIEDICALTFSGCSIEDGVNMLHGEIWIKRDELVTLIEREGLPVPVFLIGDGPMATEAHVDMAEDDAYLIARMAEQEEERKRAGYFTVDEAVEALNLAHPDVPQDVFRSHILRGIEVSELRVYDPRAWKVRAEYHSRTRRAFYELLCVNELNTWFAEVKGMPCRVEFEHEQATNGATEGGKAAGSEQARLPAVFARPARSPDERKKTTYFVTEEEIIKAFGCRDDLFRDAHKFDWVKEAKVPGRGGRAPIKPKFDPYSFAAYLPGTTYAPHLTESRAWAILEKSFPDRYTEVEAYDPRK